MCTQAPFSNGCRNHCFSGIKEVYMSWNGSVCVPFLWRCIATHYQQSVLTQQVWWCSVFICTQFVWAGPTKLSPHHSGTMLCKLSWCDWNWTVVFQFIHPSVTCRESPYKWDTWLMRKGGLCCTFWWCVLVRCKTHIVGFHMLPYTSLRLSSKSIFLKLWKSWDRTFCRVFR